MQQVLSNKEKVRQTKRESDRRRKARLKKERKCLKCARPNPRFPKIYCKRCQIKQNEFQKRWRALNPMPTLELVRYLYRKIKGLEKQLAYYKGEANEHRRIGYQDQVGCRGNPETISSASRPSN